MHHNIEKNIQRHKKWIKKADEALDSPSISILKKRSFESIKKRALASIEELQATE